MCGIGGLVMKAGNDPLDIPLSRMREALATRGPDGTGTFIDGSLGFVHTRLAIIDPSGGHQPITDSKGRTIVFNGEIYNYIELRDQLNNRYQFRTHSDTETILAAYECYGEDFIHHLRGMYAIALYDPAVQKLFLTRDPFGIKPLYIEDTPAHLAFASEPKALLAADLVSHEVSLSLLRSVIDGNYIKGPHTPYANIKRLAPGELRVYDLTRNGDLIHHSYRSFLSVDPPVEYDEDTALERLGGILEDTVSVHCRSDVGYGVFLSGGVDSSAIMQCLSKLDPTNQIHTYTAYFEGAGGEDDRALAIAVARATGAIAHEVPFGAADFETLLPQIAAYMDDPVSDYAILPTWKLAATAAKDQKVVLCGEGGDELFAGYGRYRSRWWKDWRKAFDAARPWADDLTSPGHMAPDWTGLQRRQAADIAEYLPNDLLIKLDTCLMAHGLEGRTPFLDWDVAGFAFALPDYLKLRDKTGKYLLKKWLARECPVSDPFRKKRGFTVPVGAWMNADHQRLSDLLSGHEFVKEILTAKERHSIAQRLASPDEAVQCWSLLYLTLWWTAKQQRAGVGQDGGKITEILAA